MRFLAILFSLLLIGACNSSKQVNDPAVGPYAKVVKSTKKGDFYGEKFDTKTTISYNDMIDKIDQGDTLNVVVEGYTTEVCQAKGCWMNFVESPVNTDKQVFIKFQDYAFFVPLNSGSSDMVLKGKAYSEFTSVDELRHYAEDKGASQEEIESITEPKKEYKIMASGVFVSK